MKLKKLTLNLGLMAVSTAVALVLCEFACRLFLNPADYLNVTVVDDPALGRRIAPGSTGFDQWGFRIAVDRCPSREEPDQSVGPCTFDYRRAEVCVTV